MILVGAGERASAWAALLREARHVRLVASVARHTPLAVAPGFTHLADALAAHPDAAVAAALPPHAGLEVALTLAAARRAGLVEAPLDLALAGSRLDDGARDVRVAHGWSSLGGLPAVARRIDGAAIELEVRGLPEAAASDVTEVAWHALALVLRLLPGARVEDATSTDDARLELRLVSGTSRLSLVARTDGHGVTLRARTAKETLLWRTDGREESLAIEGTLAPRSRPVVPAVARALAQLRGSGDDLFAAHAVAQLVLETVSRTRLSSIGARALASSARIARARPADLLGSLGLVGEIPPAPTLGPAAAPPPASPVELWHFRAGHKPVAFLTVAPSEVEATVASFGDVHVERRERRVEVGLQDAWTDRRDRGEPRVELYLSRDRALSERAAALQADGDPSASLGELGRLLGYPACCVAAFARRADRSNNTRNRYATAAATRAEDWPWQANNLHTVLAPWYPCRYDCPETIARVDAALAAMNAEGSGTSAAYAALLAQPVLYFTHERQLLLDGARDGDGVSYRGVSIPPSSVGLGALGDAIALGDRLVLDGSALVVTAAGREVMRLSRTDPALGFLAPFG